MPLYIHNGGLLVRNGGLAAEQGCCCSGCECGPINCTVAFSVDGVEFTWNITGYPNVIGDFAYAEQEFFLDPYENLCEDINIRYTAIKGFAYCENGKHRIGIGIHMSSSSDGECYRWYPDEFGSGDGRYLNVFYHKVKVQTLEVSACDCSDVTDLGVQNLEGFFDFGGPFSFAILAAMRGDFVSNSACGEICQADPFLSPEDCPEPPAVIFPVRQWPEICDPDNHTLSDVSVECCRPYGCWLCFLTAHPKRPPGEDEGTSCLCPQQDLTGSVWGGGGQLPWCEECTTEICMESLCFADADAECDQLAAAVQAAWGELTWVAALIPNSDPAPPPPDFCYADNPFP